jgi:hypothetical protein
MNILGGVGAVVHEEQLDILDVVDEEALVAGGHHVPGLLVGAEADLPNVFMLAKPYILQTLYRRHERVR